MPTTPVTCPKEPLTRDLDVVVNITRPISEVATDMTMTCLVTPNVTFSDGGNDRVRFYSTMDALSRDVPPNSAAFWAGTAFFSRSERPTTMSVGRVFTEPTNAVLRGGMMSVAQVKAVSNGGFDIEVDGELVRARNMNFSGVSNLADIAAVVSSAVAGVAATTNVGGVVLTTLSSGDGASLSYATAPSVLAYQLSTLSNSEAAQVMTALSGVSDGSLTMNFNGSQYGVTGLDFTSSASPSDVAAVIAGKLRVAGLTALSVYASEDKIMFAMDTPVDKTGFAACTATSTGTDVGVALKLLETDTPVVNNYTESVTAVPAKLVSGTGMDYTAIAALGAAVELKLAGKSYTVDFTGVTDIATLSTALTDNTELATDFAVTHDATSLTFTGTQAKFVAYMDDANGEALKLSSTTATSLQPVYVPAYSPVAATDVSALLMLTESLSTSNTVGYTPGDLVSEMNLIARAARCAGRAVYGWVLDAMYRDTPAQKAVADWAEARKPAYFSACTNSPQAYNTADISNIGYYVSNKGYIRTSVFYHNNPQVYPDMSYLALALSVDYAQQDSTLTMKFKQLTGIEPSPLNETQLSALESRRINCYVAIGNTSREVREGVQGEASWYTDSLVNLDNFAEEIQVEVYNVFLRNKKVPYTNGGQNMMVSAATKICKRYTSNGTFADRDVETTANETGFETLPATDIRPAPISGATVSDRAKRLAPPIAVTAYEAGAFHKVVLNVGVYS